MVSGTSERNALLRAADVAVEKTNGGGLKGFSANVGVTHVGPTPTEAPNAGDTYTTSRTGERVLSRTTYQWRLRVPGYTLWNLSFRFKPRDPRLTFSAVIKNITNSGAVLGQFTNQFGGEVTRQYTPPRRLIVSAEYRF